MPQNIVLLSEKGKINRFYYDRERGICSQNGCFAEDGTSDFDVAYFGGEEQLFYKSKNGAIIHIGNRGKKVLLKPRSRTSPVASGMKLAVYKRNLIGFYILRRQNEIMLCCQNLSEDSAAPQVVDMCASVKYEITGDSRERLCVCYISKETREVVSREFTGRWGKARSCGLKGSDAYAISSSACCGARFTIVGNDAQKNRI